MKVTGSTRGIRCAAKNGKWWCSRDAGHYGAHESRNSDGRGLIAWWNDEYARGLPFTEAVALKFGDQFDRMKEEKE